MIGILYSCELCGLHKVEAQVRYRESSEDVIAWMKRVVEPALGTDHALRSPHCHPEELQNVMIPMPPGTEWIGGPVKQ